MENILGAPTYGWALGHEAGNDAAAQKLFEDILQREPAYVGSYYHLAKLFERNGNNEEAIKWYEKGMQEAKKAGDNHAYNELRSAYEELTFMSPEGELGRSSCCIAVRITSIEIIT